MVTWIPESRLEAVCVCKRQRLGDRARPNGSIMGSDGGRAGEGASHTCFMIPTSDFSTESSGKRPSAALQAHAREMNIFNSVLLKVGLLEWSLTATQKMITFSSYFICIVGTYKYSGSAGDENSLSPLILTQKLRWFKDLGVLETREMKRKCQRSILAVEATQ